MAKKYARLLQDQDQVEHFLNVVLDYNFSSLKNIAYRIIAAEKGLVDFDIHSSTLNSTKYRDRLFKDNKKRWELRKQIINELITIERPSKDEEIVLGIGGAVPTSGILSGKQAYILIGLPASGKSGICNIISDEFNAVILDSDFAKRKIPEYSLYPWGATVVHEESDRIIFGFNDAFESIETPYETAISNNYNVVIPKIGNEPGKVLALSNALKSIGYDVHLTLVSLLKCDSTVRAVHRFYETDRYVPLGLIFDVYGNDPCISYYLIRNRFSHLFKSFGSISTAGLKGETHFCIDVTGENPANLYPFKENVLF